jgi:hypothetical protein
MLSQTITIHVGQNIKYDKYLSQRYGIEVVSSLEAKISVSQVTLHRFSGFLDKFELKETPEGGLIELPNVTPMVLLGFISWLQTNSILPSDMSPPSWTPFYAPILPEDVAIGLIDFGLRYSLKEVFNGGIYIISVVAQLQLWGEKSGPRELLENIMGKIRPDSLFCRILVMYWVSQQLETRGRGFFEDIQVLSKNRQLTQIYWEELEKVIKFRQKQSTKKKPFTYLEVEEYYWK